MPNSIKHQTIMAFDYGLRQIGVAHGQTLTANAEGIGILQASDGVPNWDDVKAMLNEWKPNLILVGLPLNMDGSESELSRLARKFARRLQGRFNVDALMVDERLTSQDAKSSLRDPSSNKKSNKIDLTKIDHLAAALILQSWLDQPNMGQQP
ncbi:MAG: Holliday junction resolvase RuvX [Cellvibrionales bacterium TMED47]|jgi:putative Holliday junction resolvase|nr:Holliday junction resolvase RuvX [Porticoccaceae bacterium]RPG82137.1 MAG: Holliday junction resolvase RuvX [Cellvibrionales bacterium TMED47]|tara:strand:+ start:62 stop:517 length:456 start_codon:yes stop_codon:yes gene_type:complete